MVPETGQLLAGPEIDAAERDGTHVESITRVEFEALSKEIAEHRAERLAELRSRPGMNRAAKRRARRAGRSNR